MTSPVPAQDIWSRLRDYCYFGHDLKYPPLTEEQARDLERRGTPIPPEEWRHFTSTGHGFRQRPEIVCYPPATEEQLRATEEGLGFPLPADLRRLYAEVSNGGLDLGPSYRFHGAIGGCCQGAPYWNDGPTIEQLASDSGWRLHPRIEEALFRHPGSYVIADSMPEGFILLAETGCSTGLEMDGATGRLYLMDCWDEAPDSQGNDSERRYLLTLEAWAPSLSVWFERWLDDTEHEHIERQDELSSEMVKTDDLPDPNEVWRGLYRFGPNWHIWEQPPEDTDLAHDAEHAIYWTYVEDAEREQSTRYSSPAGELDDDWCVDEP